MMIKKWKEFFGFCIKSQGMICIKNRECERMRNRESSENATPCH